MTVLCVVHLHLLIIRSVILDIRGVPRESLESMVNHILLKGGEDKVSHGARVGVGEGGAEALLRIGVPGETESPCKVGDREELGGKEEGVRGVRKHLFVPHHIQICASLMMKFKV